MTLNRENLFKGLIFIGYSVVVLYLISSGKISKYINPKMNYYLIVAGVIFFAMGFNYFKNIIKKNHQTSSQSIKKYLVYLIPLTIMFFLQPLSINSVLGENKSFNMTKNQANALIKSLDTIDQEKDYRVNKDESNNNSNDSNQTINEDSSNSDGNYIIYYQGQWVNIETLEEIIMIEENYMKLIEPLFIEPHVFVGKPIEIKGFVLRNDDFDDNQIVVARGLITCCLADSSIVGVMASGDNFEQYEDNQWIWVKGRIDIHEYNGELIPIILAEEVKEIPVPEQEYIYP